MIGSDLPEQGETDGGASLAADLRRRHGHADRRVLLLRLRRPRLGLLLGVRDPLADGTRRGRGSREHHGAPALDLAVAASFGVGLGHVSIFGGRLGHGMALPGAASDRGAARNADGAAEEGSHHGE